MAFSLHRARVSGEVTHCCSKRSQSGPGAHSMRGDRSGVRRCNSLIVFQHVGIAVCVSAAATPWYTVVLNRHQWLRVCVVYDAVLLSVLRCTAEAASMCCFMCGCIAVSHHAELCGQPRCPLVPSDSVLALRVPSSRFRARLYCNTSEVPLHPVALSWRVDLSSLVVTCSASLSHGVWFQ